METMSKHYAVDFFKKKSAENSQLYNRDIQIIFKDFDDIRYKFFKRER